MKQTQEFDGKNVDNAVEKACLVLNISKKNLVYDIISSGSTGIFGIVGVKKARIRVTLPDKKDSALSNDSASYNSDRSNLMSIVDEAFGKVGEPFGKIDEAFGKVGEPFGKIDETFSKIDEAFDKEIKSKDTLEGNLNLENDLYLANHLENQHSEHSCEDNCLTGQSDKETSKHSEKKKNFDRSKLQASDKLGTAKHNRVKPSRKTGKGKPVEKLLSDKIVRDESENVKNATINSIDQNIVVEKTVGDNVVVGKPMVVKAVSERHVTKKEVKGNSGSRKTAITQPYNRKNRVRKKDTWLRFDSDDALHNVNSMASSNEADAGLGSSTILPAGSVVPIGAVGNKDKSEFASDLSLINNNINYNSNETYEVFADDLKDDMQHTENYNDSLIGVDEDINNYAIFEEYDERDDGYPPKYKGEITVDVSDEAMRIGRETLQKMVSLIAEDTTVSAQRDQDRLLLKVEGGNSGVLIGRRGQTLEAMQYLTDKIVNRYSESRVRLKVDIEGYMETRKANLKTLAYKMADKAKKTGKPATINQMTAQDRRIVHLTLKDDTRVRTQSMGDGYYRRLVIFPKKSSSSFKRRKPFKK